MPCLSLADSVRLERKAADLTGAESVFLCGERATAEIYLKDDRVGRTAFSPVDALNTLAITFDPAPATDTVVYTPDFIEKRGRTTAGVDVESIWTVDRTSPMLRIAYTFKNTSDAEQTIHANVDVVSNIGYANTFRPHADDTARIEDDHVIFTDAARSNLQMAVRTVPIADAIAISPDAATTPASQPAKFTLSIVVPAGATRHFTIEVTATEGHPALKDIRWSRAAGSPPLREAIDVQTPSPVLNEFLIACMRWETANVRQLPFGPPFGIDGTKNQLWPVITASPDYHGIFANDCIQTMWEMGLLGPDMYTPSRDSVETMFRFGPKESVEWMMGSGEIWSFPNPLGDTPQVAMGACWHLLWSGDRELADKWWPDIERFLAVLPANDADHDHLEDRVNTPYPEQPDPGEYNHEMLYVQCFWREAYRKAADVAEWMGKPNAADLRRESDAIAASIEAKFATDYGLGVWLNKDHQPHPHIGHEQIIAAAFGTVNDTICKRIIDTETKPPIWTKDGPLRAEPGKGVAAGDHVWAFMRWKLIMAMLRQNETDRAIDLAEQWAAQERDGMYQAPEGFPTITGTTGKGYTWTAGRALRAIVFGLSGLNIDGEGVSFAPKLPTKWDGYTMKRITVHGTPIDLTVKRGAKSIRINGEDRDAAVIPFTDLHRRLIHVEISIP